MSVHSRHMYMHDHMYSILSQLNFVLRIRVQDLPLSENALDSPLNQVSPQEVAIRLRKGICAH
jgi:hypothetical protein